jgi:putative transposase
MPAPLVFFIALRHCFVTTLIVLLDLGLCCSISVAWSPSAYGPAAHWQQRICSSGSSLALFQERKVKPRRADDSTRWIMATLSQMFAWRDALWNVKPDTLIRWHRKGFRLFLALEIQADRKTASAKGPAAAHSRDGSPECDVGERNASPMN